MSSKRNRINNVKDTGENHGVSFGRDYHALQVKPGRHQATAAVNISTWNVRTMNRSGKLDNLVKEVKWLNISILGVAEVRWPGAGKIVSDEMTFLYSGTKNQRHEKGVGMFLDPKMAECLSGYWCISGRLTMIRLHGKPFDTVVIQCYAPTAESNDEEIDGF